jgi:hypothetical protein
VKPSALLHDGTSGIGLLFSAFSSRTKGMILYSENSICAARPLLISAVATEATDMCTETQFFPYVSLVRVVSLVRFGEVQSVPRVPSVQRVRTVRTKFD